MFVLPTEPLRSSPRCFPRLGRLSTRIRFSWNIEGRRASRLAAPAPTLPDPDFTLIRVQCSATVGKEQKTLFLCGICKPLQRSATPDRTLVAGAVKRGSSPLVGSLDLTY